MARTDRWGNVISNQDMRDRATARKLKFGSGRRGQQAFRRWLEVHRAYPESDPRHLRPGIPDDDVEYFKLLRRVDKEILEPTDEILRKYRVLVVENEATVHMSAFAFLDRYRDQILGIINDPKVSQYRKRKMRKLLRELDSGVQHGDVMPGIIPKYKQPTDAALF